MSRYDKYAPGDVLVSPAALDVVVVVSSPDPGDPFWQANSAISELSCFGGRANRWPLSAEMLESVGSRFRLLGRVE